MTLELRKFVAPEFIFGNGALELAGRYARNLHIRKALLVTDPRVTAAGWSGKVCKSLEAYDIPYVIFDRVTPNPRMEEVMLGAEIFRAEECDVIIAVGGGSVIDCAKALGIVTTNRCSVRSFEGVDNVAEPGPPLIAIPTTAGTSADVSQFAIIADMQERLKFAIISKTVIPDVALVDPQTTVTMDPYLTACTGMDALVHAIEAYVSDAHSPLYDIHALEAIRLITRHLQTAIEHPDDLDARAGMMLGSLEAGLAFSNASLGAVHAMAHSLGGYLDMPHGECNALLLEHVVAYNFDAAPQRYVAIANALGIPPGITTPAAIRTAIQTRINEMRTTAKINGSLAERGLSSSDIPVLAEQAVKDPCLVTNPRRAMKRDLEVIYEDAR
jgi:alcohol dehydrogenase class IV